jgi:hypothetical protein
VRRTTDQLRTTTSALGKHQRSTVDSGEKSFTLSHRDGPKGVKGSRVQISPARLSKWPSQMANSCAYLTWLHDQFHVLTTFFDHLFHERASLSRVSASRETSGLTCP